MTRLASSWLVYRLTADPFLLGAVNFASLIPAFILAPIAGVFVDRSAKLLRFIVWTQAAGAVQSLGLLLVTIAGWSAHTTVWALILLNLLQGVINAFDMPARQAFLPLMVTDKKDLANAIALNSTLFNAARLVGPAIAGLLISRFGEAWCFGIDTMSYVGVIWALLAMRVIQDHPLQTQDESRFFTSFKEGMSYAAHHIPIRSALTLVAMLSFAGLPVTVLLPVYAKTILGGDSTTLGILTAASGLGAVVGALILARRETIKGIGRVIVYAGAIFAVAVLCFAFSKNLYTSIVALFATGLGMIMQSASCNTVLQTVVDSDKRGRVMSLYSMAFNGMAPFGSLAAGYLAARMGAPYTLALCSILCGLSTLYFASNLKRIRTGVRAG